MMQKQSKRNGAPANQDRRARPDERVCGAGEAEGRLREFVSHSARYPERPRGAARGTRASPPPPAKIPVAEIGTSDGVGDGGRRHPRAAPSPTSQNNSTLLGFAR
jgi:hypothetical protein